MQPTRGQVIEVLQGVALPGGGTLVSRDLIRALAVEGGEWTWNDGICAASCYWRKIWCA